MLFFLNPTNQVPNLFEINKIKFSGMELKDNILVSGNADSTVKIWDILTGQCLQTLSGRSSNYTNYTLEYGSQPKAKLYQVGPVFIRIIYYNLGPDHLEGPKALDHNCCKQLTL